MKSISQETRMLFNSIKLDIRKNGSEAACPYLGGTTNKRTRMYKEIAKYEDYAKVDRDLGVITDSQYEVEIQAVRIFEKALANYSVY
ncbi:MAG: hypothetical protein LUG62_01140 [Clostridiales bacterium]|nr:hypothetical protein [Clostridiales bacterium]